MIVIILIVLFGFRHNIEASYKGVDVKYIEDPKYCEVDEDCAHVTCKSAVNIYNYNPYTDNTCEVIVGKPKCENTKCTFDEVKIPIE